MSLSPTVRAGPLIALTTLVLTGCFGGGADPVVKESFSSDNTYSRHYPQRPAPTCEAARRTLLSQGYTVVNATADAVESTKNFQSKHEVHEQLTLRVSCVPHEADGSWVFVSAVQDRYALKKSPTSASVGVGILGSVSLPIGSSDDSLVRVASVTVQDAAFYQGFFERLDQYLPRPQTAPTAPTVPTAEASERPEMAPACGT